MKSQVHMALALGAALALPADAADIGLATNKNFVVSAPTYEIAHRVARQADRYRGEIARRWLGKPLADGYQRTTIYVTIAEGQDRGRAWPIDRRSRDRHTIYLTTSRDKIAGLSLKHEVAHIVLATHTGYKNRLPVWLDEGIASQYDNARRKRIRHRLFTTGRGRLRVTDLFAQTTIGTQQVQRYALAESLTKFLLDRGGKLSGPATARLLRFGRDGKVSGWQRALTRHYGIRSLSQLENEWQQWRESSNRDTTNR